MLFLCHCWCHIYVVTVSSCSIFGIITVNPVNFFTTVFVCAVVAANPCVWLNIHNSFCLCQSNCLAKCTKDFRLCYSQSNCLVKCTKDFVCVTANPIVFLNIRNSYCLCSSQSNYLAKCTKDFVCVAANQIFWLNVHTSFYLRRQPIKLFG